MTGAPPPFDAAAPTDPFLGEWRLDPSASDFEQGPAPRAGAQAIAMRGEDLVIELAWDDADGASHSETLVTRPDGRAEAFAGGDLADALTTRIVARGVLETTASYRGRERMSVIRTLSVDASSMTVVQTVALPDQTRPTNRAVSRRVH